jgi:hypothetical protein
MLRANAQAYARFGGTHTEANARAYAWFGGTSTEAKARAYAWFGKPCRGAETYPQRNSNNKQG